MSIALQKPTDLQSRHVNAFAKYERALTTEKVFENPVSPIRKSSNDSEGENSHDEMQEIVPETLQPTYKSGEDAEPTPGRNSIISANMYPGLYPRLSSVKHPTCNERIYRDALYVPDTETASVNSFTHSMEDVRLTTSDVTEKPPTGNNITENEEIRTTSDTSTEDEAVKVPLEGFSQFFPHNLHSLQRRQLFCDVKIRAHDTELQAHKLVLAACSPYFYKVLGTRGKRDSEKNGVNEAEPIRVIDLGTSVTATGLRSVVDCMYTSTISLRNETVEETLRASSFLDMQMVVQACLHFMKKRNLGDESRKQRLDVSNGQCDSIKEGDFSTASSNFLNTTKNDFDSNPVESNHVKSDTACVGIGSTYDTKRDAIYQDVSRQKSICKDFNINRERNYERRKSETQSALKSPHDAPLPPTRVSPAVESDDDVFVEKEPSRSDRLSSDSGLYESSNSTSSTPGGPDATDLLLKHRHGEYYRHVLANSPYMLNAETMAAAVAMTSLTSPLRSSAKQDHLPVISVEQSSMLMNPWHHLIGHCMHPAIQPNMLPRPGQLSAIAGLQQTQHSVIFQHQRMQRHPLLNFAGPGQQIPNASNSEIPQYFSKRPEQALSSPYRHLMLSNLLQTGNPTLKRSLSTTSGEHVQLGANMSKAEPLSVEKSSFSPKTDGRNYLNELAKVDIQVKHKRRRSSSGTGSPDRPYKCLVCSAEFNRPANLKTHMRIHSGEKPYECKSCGARFVQVAHLRAHILIHTGEKPYPCKMCGTRFRHLQTLKSHVRIHTGEKPYACEECQVKFRHKSQLRLHLRTKHGINTNTKKTYQQVPGLKSSDISAHIKRTQEAVRMQSSRKEY